MLCEKCQAEIANLPRTHRQKQILDYYLDFAGRRGFPPSMQMIANHFGLGSKATVHKHIEALRKRGLLPANGDK